MAMRRWCAGEEQAVRRQRGRFLEAVPTEEGEGRKPSSEQVEAQHMENSEAGGLGVTKAARGEGLGVTKAAGTRG